MPLDKRIDERHAVVRDKRQTVGIRRYKLSHLLQSRIAPPHAHRPGRQKSELPLSQVPLDVLRREEPQCGGERCGLRGKVETKSDGMPSLARFIYFSSTYLAMSANVGATPHIRDYVGREKAWLERKKSVATGVLRRPQSCTSLTLYIYTQATFGRGWTIQSPERGMFHGIYRTVFRQRCRRKQKRFNL